VTNSTDDLALDGQGASASSGTGFFTVVWRRKALVFFGLAVGLVAGLLFFLQKPPTYRSQAQLVVWKKRGDPITNGIASTGIEDYVATQEALLQSSVILDKAAKLLEKDALRSPPPNNDIMNFIAPPALNVTRNKDMNTGANSNVLKISFAGPSPEDCSKVVNAVIEGYRGWLKNKVDGDTDENFAMITQGITHANQELHGIEEKLAAVRDQARLASPLLLSALSSRINDYQRTLQGLETTKISVEGRLNLINKARADGKSIETIKELYRITDLRTQTLPVASPTTAREIILNYELQLEDLLFKFGEAHPDVIALRYRIERVKQHLASINGDYLKPRSEVDSVELYIEELRLQLTQNKSNFDFIQHKLDEDNAAYQSLARYQEQEDNLKDARDRVRRQISDYTERKHKIDLMRDTPLYTAEVITPSTIGGKVSPVLITTLAVAGSLGLVLGGLLAYLAEISDKSFRTLDEVKTRLGVAVIGQVPPLPPHEPSVIEQNPLDPLLIVHHSPKSVEAEAYRGVRTSLYFSTRGKGHQVVQVTSPDQGDGKSTLIANLAVAIAQSGRRIILIDADFRRPRIHKMFGLGKAEIGLASVIAGEADLESAIYSCEVPGLSILPCGPRPANPADLLTSALFQEILEDIKKDYDFVLIDTPPMLRCSDPSVVAPRVDGVILTIRMTKNSRPPAEQAKERLNILGANLLGVVVNGVDSLNRYGYGYGYGYAYAYGEVAYGDDFQESGTKLNKPR
jgi:capsular exopolysaccharide synthesis family protein